MGRKGWNNQEGWREEKKMEKNGLERKKELGILEGREGEKEIGKEGRSRKMGGGGKRKRRMLERRKYLRRMIE